MHTILACAVIRVAMENGQAHGIEKDVKRVGLEAFVKSKMYFPEYVPLVSSGGHGRHS